METVLTGEPIPKVDPILVLELVLEMDPIPQIPIPAQNTVIPCPILIPTKNGIKTSLVASLAYLCLDISSPLVKRHRTLPSPSARCSTSPSPSPRMKNPELVNGYLVSVSKGVGKVRIMLNSI